VKIVPTLEGASINSISGRRRLTVARISPKRRKMENEPNLNVVIIDSIRAIVEATKSEVKYELSSVVERSGVWSNKNAYKETTVKIVITEQI
jgi:hypothetical protein